MNATLINPDIIKAIDSEIKNLEKTKLDIKKSLEPLGFDVEHISGYSQINDQITKLQQSKSALLK